MLSIINTSLTLPEGSYRKEVFPKRHIVLHYTAGSSASGALATWKKTPSRDGTAFIIDRNGVIYQTFDPRYWAVHLYRHEKTEDARLYKFERESIGIELVNIAWLKRTKGELRMYTDKPFCSFEDTGKYVRSQKWRGQEYWQPYTDEQYAALQVLLPELARDFQIPIRNNPPSGRIDTWTPAELATFAGVTTHCNYRKDKLDVGPAFDWHKAGLHP